MPHIHERYDFVVSAFIVHRGKVLLVYHNSYDEWLPIGGHIELDEDPEEALYREIREECGLKVRVLASRRPRIAHRGVKPLPTPDFMDVHCAHGGRCSASVHRKNRHRHIAFVYFGTAAGDRVKLHAREHREYRWLSRADLGRPEFRLTRSIRFYCREALKRAARP
ncbi:MAG TPA: NUDIX domain-containing protein [Candidatus Eisenbacteria bacterium]|nr:NUDIX domain-containing protein [Candidatus Eisenbacteria bacterium]